MNRILAGTVAATALLTLTGCFRLDLDLEVDAKDTVAGTLVAAVDTEAMESLTEMFADMEDAFPSEDGADTDTGSDLGLDEMLSDGELSSDAVTALREQGATVSVADYVKDGYIGEEVSFEGLALEDLPAAFGSEDEGGIRITRDGDTYELVMDMDLAETAGQGTGEDVVDLNELGDMDPAALGLREPEARISVTLPGEITEANGEIDGRTVTWVMTGDESKELRATATLADGDAGATGGTQAQADASADDDGSSTGVVAAVVGGVALLALLGVLLAVRARRRPQA